MSATVELEPGVTLGLSIAPLALFTPPALNYLPWHIKCGNLQFDSTSFGWQCLKTGPLAQMAGWRYVHQWEVPAGGVWARHRANPKGIVEWFGGGERIVVKYELCEGAVILKDRVEKWLEYNTMRLLIMPMVMEMKDYKAWQRINDWYWEVRGDADYQTKLIRRAEKMLPKVKVRLTLDEVGRFINDRYMEEKGRDFCYRDCPTDEMGYTFKTVRMFGTPGCAGRVMDFPGIARSVRMEDINRVDVPPFDKKRNPQPRIISDQGSDEATNWFLRVPTRRRHFLG